MIQKIFTSKTTFEELSIPEEQQYSIIANSQGQLSAVPQGDFENKTKLTFVQGSTTTAANASPKIVTTSSGNYVPQIGDLFELTLSVANTTASMSIAIDGGTTYPIFIGGVQATVVATVGLKHFYIFDGTAFNLIGSPRNVDTNTTYVSTTLSTASNTGATYTGVVNRALIDNYNGTSTFTIPNTTALGSYYFIYRNAPGTTRIVTLSASRWIVSLDGATQINNTGYIEIGQGSWVYLRTKTANLETFVESTSPNAIINATTPGNWNIGGDFIPYTNANQNVDLNEKNLTNVGTFRSKRIQNPDNLVVKTDKNKTNYLMELTDGTPLIVHQTEVTNPFNLISTPTDNFGFGIGALEENVGEKTIGIGLSALAENKGGYSIGIGENSLLENLGISVTGIGENALSKNTSHYVIGIGKNIMEYNAAGSSIGIGDESLRYNYGRNVIGIGRMMMSYNTGIDSINIGTNSMSFNTGNSVIGIGRDSLMFNDSSSLISIGNNSLNDPQPDTPKEKTFDYEDIDIPNKRIYIPSHGFGEGGDFINLIFTQGTEPIPTGFDNLYNGQAYQFMLSNDGDYIYWSSVIYGTSYERRTVNITGQGTGTGHKFTPIVKRNNSMSIGNSISWSDITKDNQTVIKGVEILALDSTIASIDAASDNVLVTKEWINSQGFGTQTLSSSTSNIISGSTVQRAALTGDVTASQNSNATTIANNAVTTAKIENSAVTHAKYQNIATQRILGRGATGTGNVQELTLGSNLSISGSTLNATSGIQGLGEVLSIDETTQNGKIILTEESEVVFTNPKTRLRFVSLDGNFLISENGESLVFTHENNSGVFQFTEDTIFEKPVIVPNAIYLNHAINLGQLEGLYNRLLTPQIEVSGSQTVHAGWNGKEVTFMSSGLLTIPNFLVDEFSFALAADSGVTITWAIASPFTWRVAGLPVGDAPPTMTDGQFCQVSRRKGTNEIRVRGL